MKDQEAESQYPFHQRESGSHPQPFEDEVGPDTKFKAKERHQRSSRGPVHQRELATTPQFPQGRFKNALIAGVIAGVLCSIESIIIAFTNTGNYQQASKYSADKIPVSLAFTILGVACLTYFIALLICLAAGYITGKVAVQRRLGFLTGFVAGIVTYGISFLLAFIPNYPGHLPGSGAANAGVVLSGLLVVLISFVITGIIAGLVGLLGAWLATRRHPYYVGYSG